MSLLFIVDPFIDNPETIDNNSSPRHLNLRNRAQFSDADDSDNDVAICLGS